MANANTKQKTGLISGLPTTSATHDALLTDLIGWIDNTVCTSTPFSTEEIARMLVHSHHLQGLARRHSALIAPILNGDASSVIDDAIATYRKDAKTINSNGDDVQMMAAIRQLRQKTALAVALGDISGQIDIDDQMLWLSDAADTAIEGTARYLMWQASRRKLMPPPADDLTGCGWSILALGKLGAHELNYSSDADLIILHDPQATPLFQPDKAQAFYVDLTRSFVKLLSHATGDGIGWRIDLRLRPDPGATAVSIQREAALTYYESIARTWERAAFIRARAVGGDQHFGAEFLDEIQPFVWRRTLDYTVMDDMKMMLRRPAQGDGWAGFNLKTGENGIRKIEFLTHVLQLVAGGRNPQIRCRSTLPALQALAAADWISTQQADAISYLYMELRQVEHRLQMLADAQTHSLPRGDAEMNGFGQFLGWPDAASFLTQLGTHLAAISVHANHRFFADDPSSNDSLSAAPLHGLSTAGSTESPMLEDEEQLGVWLQGHGFVRSQDIVATLSGWMAGRIAATRSERARMLLSRLVPDIMVQLSMASDPDEAFGALAQFIEGLPASVQIFSLLDHNRHLTKLLCDMLVLSPRMALYLRHYPALFDLVLFKDFFAPLPPHDELKARLKAEIDNMPVEQALQTIQRHAREWRFQIEAQTLSGIADEQTLGRSLSMIADIVIAMVLGLARRDMERRHGRIAGSIAIIGLGRLGVQDLTAQSDLDLIAVYDVPEEAAHNGSDLKSDGARALSPTPYFTRLTQTFINWMSMPDVAGRFNDIDMRLRPDGEKGNIAIRTSRLSDYFANEAWLWERLAIAKARIIACDDGSDDGSEDRSEDSGKDDGGHNDQKPIQTQLSALITTIIATPLASSEIAAAVNTMRDRLRGTYQNAPALQLRKQYGGIGEMDLLVQGLRLQHTTLFTGSGQNINVIIEQLRDHDAIDAATASDIMHAATLFSRLHHYLRLCLGSSNQTPDNLPAAVWGFLLRQMDMPDADYLLAELADARAGIDAIFDTIFGANSNL